MRRLLMSYRLSPIGGAVIFVLGAAILVLAAGPRHDETPAFVVIVAVITIVCVRSRSTFGGGRAGRYAGPTLDERRAEFHPPGREESEEPAEEGAEEEAWARERERHRRRR